MSWDPETDALPATVNEAVSAVAMTIALAVPLLLVVRLVSQIG